MKVLILSKTHIKARYCVGAVALEGFRPLRLLTADGMHQPADTPYEIGQIWEMEYRPFTEAGPPHSEGVCLRDAGKLLERKEDLREFLTRNAPIWRGPPTSLFDGTLKQSDDGGAFITRERIPAQSTGFWVSDLDLEVRRKDDRVVYRYFCPDMNYRILYSGVEEPVPVLKAGTLLRVSLSKWWPEDGPEWAQKSHLRLSGWYL